MARSRSTEWSDKQLVVYIGKAIFAIPEAELGDYASAALQSLGPAGIEEFFEKFKKQAVKAAYVRIVIEGDADFVPDYPSTARRRPPGGGRKGGSRTPRSRIGPSK